ncbi:type IV pilus biogenesis protein PilM [Kurthia sibirica]|uniref:Pilus assembly protein PilM n=1 Tax=Kurthia sibirica TaxID=202750 RepID=A0A2U3AID8_9BACL|nr:pilus assembly protein PilM [Kurthia sibirica]PWI24316.1 hypothetical protein DEX24_13920 [Kurthia sibirica]GEK34398.1 hypothetical protein KSI01_19310 [Kurthia sibirica]
MLSNKDKQLSIVYDDFSITVLAVQKDNVEQGITYQIPLEDGVIVQGLIEDEDTLFTILREAFKKLKLKKYAIRFLAPNNLVFMKKIMVSGQTEPDKSIKDIVEEKIGDTIQLPFDYPVFDLHDDHSAQGEISIFAAEKDEITKWQSIFEDLGHFPEAVDIEILADLRLLEQVMPEFMLGTYLVIDWSKTNLMLAIVQQGNVEYIKHHKINTLFKNWEMQKEPDEQLKFELLDMQQDAYRRELEIAYEEIKKAMHFYQFSLNRGSKEIQRIVNTGDHPLLTQITTNLKKELTIPVNELTQSDIAKKYPNYDPKYATLLGLAIKEVTK